MYTDDTHEKFESHICIFLNIFMNWFQEYKVGDQVYARWTDCKMYPAKITAIPAEGNSYMSIL